jgi:hypothetical protein
MSRVATVFFALALCGCASPSRIERNAERHQERSQELAARGDQRDATREQRKAEQQWSKANTRRGFADVLPIVFH